MKIFLIFLFFLASIICSELYNKPLIWPLPKEISYGNDTTTFAKINKNNFTFHFNEEVMTSTIISNFIKEILCKYYRIIFESEKIERYYDEVEYDFSY